MSDRSLGRIVKLRVFATSLGLQNGVPQITYDQGYTEFSSVQGDGTDGYRIKGRAIQVQPTVGFNTNQITLQIYNLGPDSRAVVESKVGTKMTIAAGYGNNPKQIALGDILWARTHKDNSDFITEVIAGDSHFGLTSGRINTSFKGPTTYKQVIDACLVALEESEIFVANVVYPTGGYNNGYVLTGSPFVILADVCRKAGSSFNVVGGGVYILPIGQDLGAPIIEVSTDTGMIGIPEVHAPGTIGVIASGVPVSPDLDMSFKHLLRPELVLSQKIRMRSKFINGDYVILRNVFDFDSWSGPFENQCECQKVLVNG